MLLETGLEGPVTPPLVTTLRMRLPARRNRTADQEAVARSVDVRQAIQCVKGINSCSVIDDVPIAPLSDQRIGISGVVAVVVNDRRSAEVRQFVELVVHAVLCDCGCAFGRVDRVLPVAQTVKVVSLLVVGVGERHWSCDAAAAADQRAALVLEQAVHGIVLRINAASALGVKRAARKACWLPDRTAL